MRIAIIGKRGAGKTTIFNALTGAGASLGKREEHIKEVRVPDERLIKLLEFNPGTEPVFSTITFIDTKELNFREETIRNADAYLLVVGNFMGNVKVEEEVREVEEEMMISDLDVVEKRLSKLRKEHHKDQERLLEEKILERFKGLLDEGKPLRGIELDKREEELIRGYAFSSLKPLFVLVNEKEGEKGEYNLNLPVLSIQGKLEMEISELPEEERPLFLKEMGIEEPAVDRLIKEVYRTCGLITFFTLGKKETRAWSIKKGTTAKEAAGKIHTDMERGFIRAQVINFEDLVRAGSMKHAREMGLLRLEGKDYVVQDGDVVEIRFSV
ncbi:redox-regulated ATPase YchF [bacterium]|nr:MAG: redox-regulated ATPase YchF [bacterium]